MACSGPRDSVGFFSLFRCEERSVDSFCKAKKKYTGKNGFVTATKLGTTNEFFVASTKKFAATTKRFVDRTKHFAVVTKYFCHPYFNKCLLCWYNKTIFSV